jgi:hypothetical protein
VPVGNGFMFSFSGVAGYELRHSPHPTINKLAR